MRTRAALVALTLWTVACSSEQVTNVERDFVVAGRKAHGVEVMRKGATGRTLVQREMRLVEPDGTLSDVVKLLAEIEPDGDVRGASLRWEGTFGRRYVELRRTAPGARELVSRGNDETVPLPAGRIRIHELAELQHGAFDVELDLTHASIKGAQVLSDEVRPAHRARAPFIESGAPAVDAWCRLQSAEAQPLAAARQVADALRPKLAADRARGPASALATVQVGAWDEGGAALMVACLRTLGHAARVVSGTVDGAPRTWAQVHDGARFVDVDPLGDPGAHVVRAEGFRDAWLTP